MHFTFNHDFHQYEIKSTLSANNFAHTSKVNFKDIFLILQKKWHCRLLHQPNRSGPKADYYLFFYEKTFRLCLCLVPLSFNRMAAGIIILFWKKSTQSILIPTYSFIKYSTETFYPRIITTYIKMEKKFSSKMNNYVHLKLKTKRKKISP